MKNYLVALAKLREIYADQFARLFHVPLRKYWDPMTGFDLPRFDVEVVKSRSEEAMIDVVRARYGEEAVACIEALIDPRYAD